MLYFLPFLCSFLLVALGIALFLRLRRGVATGGSRTEKGREDRKKHISRFGGFIAGGVFLGVFIVYPPLVLTRDVWGLIIGCLGMLVLGVWDDIQPLPAKWQLFFQTVIVLVVILYFGVYITDIPSPLGGRIELLGTFGFILSVVFATAWFLLIINALNWSDGIDGVAPGTVVLAGLAFFSVALRPEVMQPPVAILALALAGAYLGLFLFNIHPARIFSGTAGVFVAGFAIAYLSLFAGAKIATAFLVLALPVADALRVLWFRFRSRDCLTQGDTRHIHFALMRYGWGERVVGLFLLGFVGLTTVATLVLETSGKMVVFGIWGILLVASIYILRK